MKPYPGLFYTGDGAARDEHGYIWIKGRIDGTYLLPTLFSPFECLLTFPTQTSSTYPDIVCQQQRSSLRLSCTRVLLRLLVRYLTSIPIRVVSHVFTLIVIGTADELTGQAVFAFVTLKPCVASFIPQVNNEPTNFAVCSEFAYDPNNETGLVKELVLQVRKVIGPFAAPKKIFIVSDLPKTRSGKVRFCLIALLRSLMLTFAVPSLPDHAPHHAKDRCRRGRPAG